MRTKRFLLIVFIFIISFFMGRQSIINEIKNISFTNGNNWKLIGQDKGKVIIIFKTEIWQNIKDLDGSNLSVSFNKNL